MTDSLGREASKISLFLFFIRRGQVANIRATEMHIANDRKKVKVFCVIVRINPFFSFCIFVISRMCSLEIMDLIRRSEEASKESSHERIY